MKVLILHDEGGKQDAALFLKCVKNAGFEGEKVPAGSPKKILSLLKTGLSDAACIVIVSSSLEEPWASFAAGYAAGREIKFFYKAADSGSWAKLGIPLEDGSSFSLLLEREKAVSGQNLSGKEAKSALLEKGIPVSPESLWNCVLGGKQDAVSLFLHAGYSPDQRDKNGVPLLCLAARAGKRDIVKLLLEAGASVNLQAGDRKSTALIDAVSLKRQDIAGDLVAAGANVNLASSDGQSALIIAVAINDEVNVEMLLKKGANTDTKDNLGTSARRYAELFHNKKIEELFKKYAAGN
jgi:hypothetical protein